MCILKSEKENENNHLNTFLIALNKSRVYDAFMQAPGTVHGTALMQPPGLNGLKGTIVDDVKGQYPLFIILVHVY